MSRDRCVDVPPDSFVDISAFINGVIILNHSIVGEPSLVDSLQNVILFSLHQQQDNLSHSDEGESRQIRPNYYGMRVFHREDQIQNEIHKTGNEMDDSVVTDALVPLDSNEGAGAWENRITTLQQANSDPQADSRNAAFRMFR